MSVHRFAIRPMGETMWIAAMNKRLTGTCHVRVQGNTSTRRSEFARKQIRQ
jgi:hypothetical protein